MNLKKLRVAYITDNGGTGRNATEEDTKKTVRQVAKWLEGGVASVTEDAPTKVLMDLAEARRKLSQGDGGAFYQRLADKWGTKNISPLRKRSMETATPISSAEMVLAWEQQDECKSRMLAWMTNYDVLICPVNAKPAQPIDAEAGAGGGGGGGGPDAGWPYTGVFNCTGWPVTWCAPAALPMASCPSACRSRGRGAKTSLWPSRVSRAQGGGWRKPPI